MTVKNLLLEHIGQLRTLGDKARVKGNIPQAKIFDRYISSLLQEHFPELCRDEAAAVAPLNGKVHHEEASFLDIVPVTVFVDQEGAVVGLASASQVVSLENTDLGLQGEKLLETISSLGERKG
jgi:hypothetical protein